MTVSALARQFDVKVASLYSHLKNSQDLRTRIALLALEELADRVAAALAGRAGKDALAAFANVYRDYAREHPGRYAAAQLRLDPETAAASAGVRHARMTRAILRGYDLTEPDQTHAVRLLGSVFHGYVSLETGRRASATAPPTPRRPGHGSSTPSTPCCATGPRPDPEPRRPHRRTGDNHARPSHSAD